MKFLWNIVGGIIILMGAIWVLQGLSILPGSFMTGDSRWTIYGAIAIAVGVGVLVFDNRRRRPKP